MKVTAVITALVKSKSWPASAAPTIAAVNIDAGGFKHARVIPFAKATLNQAELFALSYVLTSIKSDLADTEFEIITTNQYLERMLMRDETGQFAVRPELNVELVKQVRDLVIKNPRVTIKAAPNERIAALKDLMKKTVEAIAK